MNTRRLDGPLGRVFVQVLATPYWERANERAEELRRHGYRCRVVQEADWKVFRSRYVGAERWKTIPDFPAYQVSDHGRIRRWQRGPGAQRGKILEPWESGGRDGNGYYYVGLCRGEGDDWERGRLLVHRLVAEAFLGPPPFEGAQVDHRDSDRVHNHVRNLQWVTNGHNQKLRYQRQKEETPGWVKDMKAPLPF